MSRPQGGRRGLRGGPGLLQGRKELSLEFRQDVSSKALSKRRNKASPSELGGHWSKAWLGLTSTLQWPLAASVIRPHLTQPAPS